jgi:hypothetical protein
VFRTNTSYQRWHEARCVFGRISDAARDVWRQVGRPPLGPQQARAHRGRSGRRCLHSSGPAGSFPTAPVPQPIPQPTPQVLAVFPRDSPEARASMGKWLVAYCYAAKWALREEGRRRADLEGWLTPRELDTLVGGFSRGRAGEKQAASAGAQAAPQGFAPAPWAGLVPIPR